MKKKIFISFVLLILLTTITSQQKDIIHKFSLKIIKIENNFFVKEKEIKKSLAPIYGKNLFFLNNIEIEKALMQISFIESFKLKKIYPNTLKIIIFEKQPIAILFDKKKKYYLSEKSDLIEFVYIKNYENLPLVIGNKEKFKDFYIDLKKTNFPLDQIKKFTFYESNRWDIETVNKKLIKLPTNNYLKSIENYLDLIRNQNLNKYKMFDFRIENQIIMK